ncbi:hypothetical protein A2U01_0003021 [Trifolium medium]|uniref:CCHC-type domain-containing protein n=1 Tax=Trifolium medium TaxID=97028 RepID=A0A392M4C2_9FABA|nr:hypothetical protein [Trifolium medium]
MNNNPHTMINHSQITKPETKNQKKTGNTNNQISTNNTQILTTPRNQINIPHNQILIIESQLPAETRKNSPNYIPHEDIPESSNARNQNPPQSNIPRSFLYSDNVIHEGLPACTHSIIGKIITAKPIHVGSIQNGLESIWGAPPGLKVQELGGKILQFFMNEPADIDRILYGNPWIFRNSWLVVKPWDRETDYHEIDFDHVPIWIQLWGLPPHCKTKQMGTSIGTLMGNVEASEFYEYPGKQVIIKIKVAININNPITSGIHVGNPTDGTSWVDYRYEKLPQVCFKCGMIGHTDKLCRNQALVLDTLAPLGPWIRSTQYGKRKMEDKDRKFYSNPSHAKNFGQYSPPVPSDLLEKLAAMRVNTAKANQTQHPQPKDANHSPQNIESYHGQDMQSQQEERNKKAHRLSYDQETTNHPTSDIVMKEQSPTIKRQKMEELPRVGTAKQASPQP